MAHLRPLQGVPSWKNRSSKSRNRLTRLDRLDSESSRQTGDGIWGSDSYGIAHASAADDEDVPQVVCTYHPQIPEAGDGGLTGVDDDVRDRLNDALWGYCERVAERIQQKVDECYAAASDER
ncbi:DUF7539 family protein [Halorussus ruber]|uniref:DUF7539 family protein n=1 Tax=Halorussus ruber TaxID=1126238 RepID=UPI001B2FE6D7|nr:hypothetical protein [Halorussus ruber]